MGRNGYINFDDLNDQHKKLLGRKNTLLRMIEKRYVLIDDKKKELSKLKMEVKPIEDELDEILRKIKVISVDEKFEPKISVHPTTKKGQTYLRCEISFGKGKPKQKQIPRKDEKVILDKLEFFKKSYKKKTGREMEENEVKNFINDECVDWCLNWWREEGILLKN